MPNGFIREYEVSYKLIDSFQPFNRASTGPVASFTTKSDLEMGTEFIFSVTASTQVGAGETASVVVSTLTRPRKEIFLNCIYMYRYYLSHHSCCTRSDSIITEQYISQCIMGCSDHIRFSYRQVHCDPQAVIPAAQWKGDEC